MPLQFAFITQTMLVSASDLYVLARHLEKNAQHCAADWGLEPPLLDVFESTVNLPQFCVPLLFVDEEYRPGVAAYHRWDFARSMPAGRVFVQRASGLLTGETSVAEAAAHEVVEALVDPRCDLWTDLPGRPGVQVAYEVADPVQDTYDLGDGVPGANYVTHHYFDSRLADPDACRAFLAGGGRFDRKGTLRAPGAIGPEGYLVLRNEDRKWLEDQNGELAAEAMKKPGALHPLSRTARRIRDEVRAP